MSAIAPRAIRRYEDEPRAPIDRALSLATALALGLFAIALVASVVGAFARAHDDVATVAAFSASTKAESLARAIAHAPARRSHLDAADALAAILDDPALRLAQPTTLAVARVRASDLWSSTHAPDGTWSARTTADALVAFDGALENVRTDVTSASMERARVGPREALGWAIAIVIAFAVTITGATLRVRRTRATADRFSGMLERMLADMARATVEAEKTKRATVVHAKARGRLVMTVDFRYVVTRPYSDELGELLDIDDLDGYPFGSLLRRIAPDHDRAALAEFAERLFDHTYPDTSLARHPLHAVRFGARTLDFEFERIWDREEIESIVVAVSDITQADVGVGSELRESQLRGAAYEAFLAATARPLVDALVSDIATYTLVLGRTLRSNDMARQLGKLHEGTTALLDRLVALDFTYLTTRVQRFDARTVDLLGRPYGAGAGDLSYAIAVAELTVELEAFRAIVPRALGVTSAAQSS